MHVQKKCLQNAGQKKRGPRDEKCTLWVHMEHCFLFVRRFFGSFETAPALQLWRRIRHLFTGRYVSRYLSIYSVYFLISLSSIDSLQAQPQKKLGRKAVGRIGRPREWGTIPSAVYVGE